MAKRRLEIGPGKRPLGRGWDTLDVVRGNGANAYKAKWGEELLPFADATYAEVYASHVLEHVPWMKTVAALAEVARILQPGGLLEVWVPDFRYLVQCYLADCCGDDWRHDNPQDDPRVWLNGRLFTYGPEPNWHKAVFDFRHLAACLSAAGLTQITRLQTRTRGHSHGPIELGVEAYKRT